MSQFCLLVCHLLFILACTTYVIGQMTGAGVAFSRFLEVDSNTGLIIAAIVVLFYVVLGGMKGITYTQVAQHCGASKYYQYCLPTRTCQPALAYEARPEWMKNWETTDLLKYEDKNSDGLIQYYNDKNEEYATTVTAEKGWQGNELTVNNDILVLANPEIANLLLK